jgi:hypothetical protein
MEFVIAPTVVVILEVPLRLDVLQLQLLPLLLRY